MKITELKENPKNPRFIKDEKFNSLVHSLRAFPEMMGLRPIILDDETSFMLGGHKRYKAIQYILANPLEGDEGLWVEMRRTGELPKDWVKVAFGLSESQKDEFIIKDNAHQGEWDWDGLANNFEPADIEAWGLDIPNFTPSPMDKDGGDGETWGEGGGTGDDKCKNDEDEGPKEFLVSVVCKDEADMTNVAAALESEGYICRIDSPHGSKKKG